MAIKRTVTRKAAKAAAMHTAHGTASKLRRDPLRTVTLLVIGAVAGWFAGRAVTGTASVSTGP